MKYSQFWPICDIFQYLTLTFDLEMTLTMIVIWAMLVSITCEPYAKYSQDTFGIKRIVT